MNKLILITALIIAASISAMAATNVTLSVTVDGAEKSASLDGNKATRIAEYMEFEYPGMPTHRALKKWLRKELIDAIKNHEAKVDDLTVEQTRQALKEARGSFGSDDD